MLSLVVTYQLPASNESLPLGATVSCCHGRCISVDFASSSSRRPSTCPSFSTMIWSARRSTAGGAYELLKAVEKEAAEAWALVDKRREQLIDIWGLRLG